MNNIPTLPFIVYDKEKWKNCWYFLYYFLFTSMDIFLLIYTFNYSDLFYLWFLFSWRSFYLINQEPCPSPSSMAPSPNNILPSMWHRSSQNNLQLFYVYFHICCIQVFLMCEFSMHMKMRKILSGLQTLAGTTFSKSETLIKVI